MSNGALKFVSVFSVSVSLLMSFTPAARSSSADVAQFYAGHVVTVVVGSSVGGGYDLNARLVAQHIGKYIPGNPTVIVENMPGAGGLKSAGYMYSVAPKDGSYIAILERNLTVEPLFTSQPYDGGKFAWLGSLSSDVSLCIASSVSKVKSFTDLQTKSFVAADQAAGSDSQVFASLLKNLFGAKIKTISGYPGTSDMQMAMERGEVDGMCGVSYSTLKTLFSRELKQKKITILVQAGLQRDRNLPDVPSLLELAKSERDRAVIKLLVGTQGMARPFMAPPGIPIERKIALRAAFDKTMTDPKFIADAAEKNVDVSPMTGEAVDKILGALYASPPAVINRASQVIAP